MKIIVVNNYKDPAQTQKAIENIERSTGQKTTRVEYKEASLQAKVTEEDPDLVILTGSSALLSKPETRKLFEPEMALVRTSTFPILGICYGHQIIGSAFGSPMRDLGKMLRGYAEVNIVGSSPLFDNLPSRLIVAESHRQELTVVPRGFQHLADSATSRVEAMAHKSRPIFGVQFHPERNDREHPHGNAIIQNLLRLVL